MNNEHICPVMGHEIEDISTAPSSEYEGTTWYFCCEDCKEKFDLEPDKYIENGSGGHHHH